MKERLLKLKDQAYQANFMSYSMLGDSHQLIALPCRLLFPAIYLTKLKVSSCRQFRCLLFPSGVNVPSRDCRLMDVFGDNAIFCSTHEDLVTHHHNFRNFWYRIWKSAKLRPRFVKKTWFWPIDENTMIQPYRTSPEEIILLWMLQLVLRYNYYSFLKRLQNRVAKC